MSASQAYSRLNQLVKSPQHPGGYYRLQFVASRGVQEITHYNPSTGTIAGIILKPNVVWFEGLLAPMGRGYKEQQQSSDAGAWMDITVEGFLPFESISNTRALNAMKYDRFIVLVYSPNPEGIEIVRIVGDLKNPARFSHTMGNGDSFRGIAGTNIAFSWKNEDKAPLYVPAWGSSIHPGGDTPDISTPGGGDGGPVGGG